MSAAGDAERANTDTPLAARVATVQNDIIHMSGRIDKVEVTIRETRDELKSDIKETRDELKSDIARVEFNLKKTRKELKSDIARVERNLKETRDELKSDIKETRHELKSDIARVETGIDDLKSELKTELGNGRRALYTLCGTAIVAIVAALAKGAFVQVAAEIPTSARSLGWEGVAFISADL